MKTANKNASNNARKLLHDLKQIAGNHIITGQHTQTKASEEIQYIKKITGKSPKLRGFELLSYSTNIPYDQASPECLKEVSENRGTLETALQFALEEDGILSFCFHWFSPIGGEDKSFYTEHTDFDPEKVLVDGTAERIAFFRDLDVIAKELKVFSERDIPILFRPFHEAEGTWFWWGSKGTAVAAKLYVLVFEYFTGTYHLNNLLWVWSSYTKEGYPGDDYVDIIGCDLYLPEYKQTDYQSAYSFLHENLSEQKVYALTEVGYMPDIRLLEQSRVPWSYFMTWSKEFCMGEKYNTKECLQEMYQHDYAITL